MTALFTVIENDRPWFEAWFVGILILFIVFALILFALHKKREKEERQEKIRQAELTRELKLAGRQSQLQLSPFDDDDGTLPTLFIHLIVFFFNFFFFFFFWMTHTLYMYE